MLAATQRADAPVRDEPSVIELFALPLRGRKFQLDDTFLEQYAGKQPAWGPVGYVTYKRTYARYQDPVVGGAHRSVGAGKSEEYWQTVARVVEGVYQIQQRHCQSVGTTWRPSKAQRSAQTMYRLMWEFKFLPPGRGLWMMGTPFIETHGSAALNNCGFASTESIEEDFAAPFTFLMDMSMLGVGIGGDLRGAGTVTICEPRVVRSVHTIPDTREGWVDAVRVLLTAYATGGNLPAHWDYSAIRPAGVPIKGFGGTAAGPEPLKQLLEVDLPSVLDPLRTKPITGAAIVDIFNLIGKCVVAGNVRRTAEIMFGAAEPDFMDLKNPEVNSAALMSHRWASNNSVFAEVGMDYTDAARRTALNGEPGYLWLDNVRAFGRMGDAPNYRDRRAKGSNPCVEQTLEDRELCCLVETFPAHHESLDEYNTTLKYAYLYAKTVTCVPTHHPMTNAVMMRNRRIGTSQSGIVQSFAKHGRRTHFDWCEKGYQFLVTLDEQYSDWMCVRPSIKMTSVKPSGSVSKLPGSTCGMHWPCAQYYIQRIRFGEISELLPALLAAGYPMEPDLTTPRTMVVEFPVETPYFTKGEADVSPWEQLSVAAAMQHYWADNQVSCTVKFHAARPETLAALAQAQDGARVAQLEAEIAAQKLQAGDEIKSMLELYEDKLKGISFLPHTHGYAQAPWEPISKEDYERRVAALSPLDLSGDTHEVTEKFCDGDTCLI